VSQDETEEEMSDGMSDGTEDGQSFVAATIAATDFPKLNQRKRFRVFELPGVVIEGLAEINLPGTHWVWDALWAVLMRACHGDRCSTTRSPVVLAQNNARETLHPSRESPWSAGDKSRSYGFLLRAHLWTI